MKLKVLRLGDDGDTTIGAFYINGILKCGTIEDQEQTIKVFGETRIPNGIYRVGLREAGSYHTKYSVRYKEMHKGMLCIYNENNWVLKNEGMTFQYILIHTGNTDDHTAGCLLLNDSIDFGKHVGMRSADAYKKYYPEIAAAIEAGEEVTIEYVDVETGK